MIPLLALGPHIFDLLPLSLQRIEERTKARWPAVPRFGGTAARQFTGMDEDSLRIEGLIFEDEWAGHDRYLALKATQRLGEPVMMVGWGAGGGYASVFGRIVILEVGATHEHLRADGIGRKIAFSIEVASFGGDAGVYGGLFG
jgi:phage protein U